MSWAAEDWTTGLTGRVLQKVRELQTQQERMSRERQQKQLQLDNAEAALHKQKLKSEELRTELAAVQRELTGVREQAQGEVRARERLAQELHSRQAQVYSLEGQLEAAHTLTTNLNKEIKRLEAELEKLQRGNVSGDSMLFSTPCWNIASPWDQNNSRQDEQVGYRAEGDSRMAHVRQQLLFSESPKSAGASSPFAQQPASATPTRRSTRHTDATTPSAMFPWERDNTKTPVPKGRGSALSCPSPVAPSYDIIAKGLEAPLDPAPEEELRKERDAQRGTIKELQTWVQSLEADVRVEVERRRESEVLLGEARKELVSREQGLSRTKDELGRAHTLIGQERERAQASEQRVKQLQEELKCQRQNAETSRCHADAKKKEMEKEHQRELLELQKERQALERLHQQESLKLSQEIQQAHTLHNTLQAQYEKLALQKQAVERELDGVRGKLKATEADLKETEKREVQLQVKLTEALKDNEGLSVVLEQLKRKEKGLEGEVRRLKEELADTQRLLKQFQDQPPVPTVPVISPQYSPCGESYSAAVSRSQHIAHQPQSRKKKAVTGNREETIQSPVKYPSDREPGEGIDSEHIKDFGSEQQAVGREKSSLAEEEADRKDRGQEALSSTLGDVTSSDEEEAYPASPSVDLMHGNNWPQESKVKNSPLLPRHGQCQGVEKAATDFKRENAALREELQDTKQELQRRLDDLEGQRRAEAEARTKLKQLSRKHSTQTEQLRQRSKEQQEEQQRLERQLEEARQEVVRLKQALECKAKEAEREQEVCKNEEAAKGEREECQRLRVALAEMERKGSELEEESGRLRTRIETLGEELLQEREDREKGRDKERQSKEQNGPQKEHLLSKIAELEAELQGMRNAQKENSTLKSLPLSCDNKAIVFNSEDVIPSPMDNVSFCQAVNLQNAIFSQENNLITDFGASKKLKECSREVNEAKSSGSAQEVVLLRAECEALRGERDQEAARATMVQNRLEVLQKQVNSQTKQLTLAFESQSSNIEGLLQELQERDTALQRSKEELRLCQEEMAMLKASQLEDAELAKKAFAGSDIAKELSDFSGTFTTDIIQPKAHYNKMSTIKAKIPEWDTEALTVKNVSKLAANTEDQTLHRDMTLISGPLLQTSNKNVSHAASTDVQPGRLECEIVTSGNTVACMDFSGRPIEGSLVDGETTVQEAFVPKPPESCPSPEPLPMLPYPNQTESVANVEPADDVGTVVDAIRRHAEQTCNHFSKAQQLSPADIQARQVRAVLMDPPGEDNCQREGGHKGPHLPYRPTEGEQEELQGPEVQSLRSEIEMLKAKLAQLVATSGRNKSDSDSSSGEHSQDSSPTHIGGQRETLRLSPEGQGELYIKPSYGDSQEQDCWSQSALLQLGRSADMGSRVEGRGVGDGPGNGHSAPLSGTSPNLQALQAELCRLEEENRQQAQELHFWRLAAQEPPVELSPGATKTPGSLVNSGSLLLIREDHILLACGAEQPVGQVLETRTVVHQCHSDNVEGHCSTTRATTETNTQDDQLTPLPFSDGGADAEFLKSVFEAGDLSAAVSSLHEVETVTQTAESRSDDLCSNASLSDTGADNTKEKAQDSISQTKTVWPADKDSQLAVLQTTGANSKANNHAYANIKPWYTTRALDDAAGSVVVTLGTADIADHGIQYVVDATTKSRLADSSNDEELVETIGMFPGVGSVETPLYTADAVADDLDPQKTCLEKPKGQSSGVTVSEGVQISREVKSSSTQTDGFALSPEIMPSLPPGQPRADVLEVGTQTEGTPTGEDEGEVHDFDEDDEDDDVTESPCPSPDQVSESERLLLSGSFPIPANPAHLAERIRRNRNRMSAAYDDTVYEPYGLPEVVMKGFADIPTGPACPYVLRRGLLGTPALPLPPREEEEHDETDP